MVGTSIIPFAERKFIYKQGENLVKSRTCGINKCLKYTKEGEYTPMYLSMLSNEEKHLFLELELYMAKTDGDFALAERDIIDAHCIEMHIDNNNYECEYPLDIVLSKLSQKCNNKTKHIIFLELTATVLADEIYHDSEKTMINKLAKVLEISENDVEEAFDLISNMKSLYQRCADYIKGV